uniref:Vacuolar fusion protein CCZ1 homolog n=1 Tax=Phallusia mammillata TaxID=59560 RepID=A0A6F9D9D3_9ASCI|nr:vacuolar fusion protein CCZ1 homolog [Phallusia mammillata]
MEIDSYFIYNSLLGPKEGEEIKKLLFYFPKEQKLFRKINDVGLCEAIVQFSNTFLSHGHCKYMQTNDRIYLFHEPEPSFWIVLSMRKPSGNEFGGIKDEALLSTYQFILEESYERFCLWHNTFAALLEAFGTAILISKCKFFFEEFLEQFGRTPKLEKNLFGGFQYFSQDKSSILNFRSLLSRVQETFPEVLSVTFFHNGQLILTDLSDGPCSVLSKAFHSQLNPTNSSRSKFNKKKVVRKLKYGSIYVHLKSVHFPALFGECQVCIYCVSNFTIIFLISCGIEADDYFSKIDMVVGAQLTSLVSSVLSITESKKSLPELNLKFLYSNKLNKSLVASNCGNLNDVAIETLTIPNDVLQKMYVMHEFILNHRKHDYEIMEKVQADCWLSLKVLHGKELYVVIHHKNANLICVNDDIKKLSFQFDNISFAD